MAPDGTWLAKWLSRKSGLTYLKTNLLAMGITENGDEAITLWEHIEYYTMNRFRKNPLFS